jgi:hypothetical protein
MYRLEALFPRPRRTASEQLFLALPAEVVDDLLYLLGMLFRGH